MVTVHLYFVGVCYFEFKYPNRLMNGTTRQNGPANSRIAAATSSEWQETLRTGEPFALPEKWVLSRFALGFSCADGFGPNDRRCTATSLVEGIRACNRQRQDAESSQ